jgi:CBS domain-containing protein
MLVDSADQIGRAILGAQSVSEVEEVATRVRGLPAHMLAGGVTAEGVTAALAGINDLLVHRLLELTGASAALMAARGCWIALGSQGRREQTIATDQDNAIVFADHPDPDSQRRVLLPLAAMVNQALDRCGFALCRGEVMAGNPRCCLALSEWRMRFAQWIERPEPEALLNAAIFFDVRLIHGDPVAGNALCEWLAAHAAGQDRFLFLMARNALDNQPPLGLVRDFALTSRGEHPHTLDLKVNGVQLFVEAARVYGLAAASRATNTLERLAAAGSKQRIPAEEVAAWREAFRFIQLLRLRLNETQRSRGEPLHNYLDPDELDAGDRRALKDTLRQAKKLQQRLARDFAPSGGAFGA